MRIGALIIAALVFTAIGLHATRTQYELQSILSVPCTTKEQQDHIRALTIQALDLAYSDYVQGQFASWMRDPGGQPARAQAGIDKALNAYALAYDLAGKVHIGTLCPQ